MCVRHGKRTLTIPFGITNPADRTRAILLHIVFSTTGREPGAPHEKTAENLHTDTHRAVCLYCRLHDIMIDAYYVFGARRYGLRQQMRLSPD